MTANFMFVFALCVALGTLFFWSFKTLPKERWQIVATVPAVKEAPNHWRGINFTYYGLFTANAYAAATGIFLLLTGALAVPLSTTLFFTGMLLAVCIPSSKLIARIVEKKRHTFTIGGASFMGVCIAPWAIWTVNRCLMGTNEGAMPLIPTMAALSIAYLFGESVGRLACISFGCCYGKPLSECHPILRRLFSHLSFTFFGETKKIAYASSMQGMKVLPIQGMTAVVYGMAGILGLVLFLEARFTPCFLFSVVAAQGWRCFSECLRADYRGGGRISAYQVMALLAVLYSVFIGVLFQGHPSPAPDIATGLKILWDPAVLLSLEALWAVTFLYTGRSMVTGAFLSFHVHQDRI